MSATFQSAFQKEDQCVTIITQKLHYLLLSMNCAFAKLFGKGTVGVGLLFVAPYLDKGHHDVVIVGALHKDHLEVPDPGRPHEHSLQPPLLRRGLLLRVHQPVTKQRAKQFPWRDNNFEGSDQIGLTDQLFFKFIKAIKLYFAT